MSVVLLAAAVTVLFPFQSSVHAYEITWSVFNKGAEYFDKIQSDPKTLVQEYCDAEFKGAQDIRIKVVKLDPKKASEKEAASDRGDKHGKVINFSSDPLVVVDSYVIRDVQVSKDTAEATIAYRRLASTDGIAGKRYMADRKSNDIVKLSLSFDGSRWWITAPPLPRVSKWALIEYSERIISSMDSLIKAGKASDGQKKYYLSNKDIVAFLRSL
ncbi:MAG TPA: hypothetical protein PLF54_00390 [Deltaproteobacteria bacterium]|nr:hypothetical protein [Deltaproteobacteria bacterium]HQJ07429.1 hypothetical protein [Deltaproteobacteria bacterium]